MKQIVVLIALSLLTCAVSAQPTTQPAGGKPTTKPISAEQMLDSMLKPSATDPGRVLTPLPDPPAADKSTGASAVAPGAPVMNLMREGSFIVDRTGRLTRGSDGQTAEFTFDADARTMKDPPLVILPNLKLMQMENAVGAISRDLRFRITGMVTEYKGRNYVLMEKVVVVPEN